VVLRSCCAQKGLKSACMEGCLWCDALVRDRDGDDGGWRGGGEGRDTL